MPWGAAIAAVAAIGGSMMQSNAAEDAADAQSASSNASIAEQRRQYDQTRADQQPWLIAGQNALTTQQALLNGDYSSFNQSPEYLWTQQQGMQGLDRSAAARGALYSGGADADRLRFSQGLASEQYGNYYNRLAGLSGTGQVAANNLGNFGQNSANQISNSLTNAGNARASSYLAQGENSAQTIGALGGIFNNWYQGNSANNGGGTGWYLGNNPGKG